MKRLFYATTLLSAILLGGGCAKDGDEAVLAISQETATLDEKAQSFDLTVTSNVYYRVNVQDKWIGLTEVSASGNDRVYSVSVEENKSTDTRVGTIKFIGDGVTPKKLTITQSGVEKEPEPEPEPGDDYLEAGVFAQWNLADDSGVNESTFASDEDKPATGNFGRYADSSTGNGKIEFYYGDQTDVPVHSGYAGLSRGVGRNGDLYVKGGMIGDYWLISVAPEKKIKAGSVIKFTFGFSVGKATTDKWMLEYSCDGGEYLPVGEVQKATETWTHLLSTGEESAGSMDIEYNYVVYQTSAYQLSEKEFTVPADVADLKIRIRPTGCLAVFSNNPTQLVDCIHNSLESRLTPTIKIKDNGESLSINGQPVIIEVVSVPAE